MEPDTSVEGIIIILLHMVGATPLCKVVQDKTWRQLDRSSTTLQSIPGMPKDGLVQRLSPLLVQLAEAKEKAASFDTINADHLFQKIQIEIDFMKEIFIRLERWESGVKAQFDAICKHFDGMCDDSNNEEEFRVKLERAGNKVADLKAHITPPLHLPDASSSSSEAPSETQLSDSNIASTELSEYIREMPMPVIRSLLSFPENAMIKKRLFFYWLCVLEEWRVFIKRDYEGYLERLIGQGIIIPFRRSHNSTIDSFRVHPSARAQMISVERECRHQGIGFVRLFNTSEQIDDLRYSDACINVDRKWLKFETNELSKIDGVAILHLGVSNKRHHIEVENIELLDWLSVRNLNYLSLQGISMITELPPSILRHSELKILDLRACYNLERLPAEITMLINLKHLDVSECYLLNHMPKGFHLLSSLQVLKGFVIGSEKMQESSCMLEELSRLNYLRKLSINIRHDSLNYEQELSELESLISLRVLTITWESVGKSRGFSSIDMTFTNHMKLPVNLEKLDIRCFRESMTPTWLSPSLLINLKRLYIRGGALRRLSSEKWSVEILRLRFLNDWNMLDSELLTNFPTYNYIEIYKCGNLASRVFRT